ncbi:hypothetical protein PAPYR_3988 [Paratrimastix pyriformis]|uniref:Uncharacterized protein n=1 Tax=Paratrimastix pyriformis TaxID=342808 RepID=A0ABQ8UM85_9EUKA|nr:hypothetical protein PAPYR_3988 [Paratrimastix pyriformis]
MLTRITTEMPHTVSIEMETFHLYDLADVSVGHSVHAFGCAMIIAERSNKNFVTPAEKERLVTASWNALGRRLSALVMLTYPSRIVF